MGGTQCWRLLKKLKETGTTSHQPGSGRPRCARTQENIDLVLSQENAPGSHRTLRQIARETGIRRSSVTRIIHNDLGCAAGASVQDSNP